MQRLPLTFKLKIWSSNLSFVLNILDAITGANRGWRAGRRACATGGQVGGRPGSFETFVADFSLSSQCM